MGKVYDELNNAYLSIKERLPFKPRVGLVLGSGLGSLGDKVEAEAVIDYKDIAGFPVSTAPGHKGRFIFCHIGDTPVVLMQGRVHFYEGYSMDKVVMPIRLMGLMGAETVFLTNASGGINPAMGVGSLMLITDQIGFLAVSPLIGPNEENLGVRFPDMSHIYTPELVKLAKKVAEKEDITLYEGVYCQTRGPQYETPAEIRAIKVMGGDAVGMSTACEAIAAAHMGLKVMGISCISNLAAGISPTPLSEQEVIEAGQKVAPVFIKLVTEIISAL